MTILIVDDHPIVRKGIHALLASAFADAEVMDASCLKEAEEACSTRDVNIMITDLDLNGESGVNDIAVSNNGAEGQPQVVARYNAAGMRVADNARGLNIEMMSDGSARKVLVK